MITYKVVHEVTGVRGGVIFGPDIPPGRRVGDLNDKEFSDPLVQKLITKGILQHRIAVRWDNSKARLPPLQLRCLAVGNCFNLVCNHKEQLIKQPRGTWPTLFMKIDSLFPQLVFAIEISHTNSGKLHVFDPTTLGKLVSRRLPHGGAYG